MNKIIKSLLVGVAVAGIASTASATISLHIEPAAQTISLGDSATYNLTVSGLAGNYVGGYSVWINFNQAIALATSISFGSTLNDFPDSAMTSGQIYLANTSFAADLSNQGNGFTLASFTLQGIGLGATALTIDQDWSYLSNAEGTGDLAFATQNGSLAVVPEPSTVVAGALLLLPFGISTLRLLRKKQTA